MKLSFNQKLPELSNNGKYLVTSDLHFGHNTIIKFCPDTRPWKNRDEMEIGLITEWNNTVSPDDIVFHLGDFTFSGLQKTKSVIDQLNGQIVWILGNHGKTIRSQLKDENKFDYLEVKYNGNKICMMHYPLTNWNNMQRGTYMLHGHLHGNPTYHPKGCRTIDVGWDANSGRILTLDEALKLCDDYAEATKEEVTGYEI